MTSPNQQDVAALVARLEKAAGHAGMLMCDPPKPSPMMALLAEAADALTAAEARIAGLEAALEPFAVGTDIFFSGDADDRTVSIGRWYGGGPMSQELPRFNADIALTVGDLRRAREALSRQEGGR